MPGTSLGLPTGKEIYDAIMGIIEPELTSELLPTLAEKYAGEPSEQKKERVERYKVAFKDYDECYAAYITDIKEKSKACARSARKDAEGASAERDQHKQDALLSKINSL